jgi:hypothetical protein
MRTSRRFAGFGRQSRPAYPAGKSPSGSLLGPLGDLRNGGTAAAGGDLNAGPRLTGCDHAGDAVITRGVFWTALIQANAPWRVRYPRHSAAGSACARTCPTGAAGQHEKARRARGCGPWSFAVIRRAARRRPRRRRGQNAAACGRFQFRAQISNWSSSHAAARARPVAYGNVKKRQTAWGRRPGKLLLRRFVVQRTAKTPTPSPAGYSPAPVSELAMPCQR